MDRLEEESRSTSIKDSRPDSVCKFSLKILLIFTIILLTATLSLLMLEAYFSATCQQEPNSNVSSWSVLIAEKFCKLKYLKDKSSVQAEDLATQKEESLDAQAGQLDHSRPLERYRRAVARIKSVPLAPRPRGSKLATSTERPLQTEKTSESATIASSTSTEAASEVESVEDEQASDDYEEVSEKTSTTSSTTTEASKKTTSTRKKQASSGKPHKGSKKSTKSTTTTTTTTTTTITEEPAEEEEAEEEVEETNNDESRGKEEEQEETKLEKLAASEKASKLKDDKSKAATLEKESNFDEKKESQNSTAKPMQQHHRAKQRPLVALPFIKPKNASVCISEAFLEFPPDLIGDKWRSRGLVLIHLLTVCYMFYSLALVCERYFMPSLEEFAQRLNLSEDVAGATLMSAGSSAPELFTAILGVFVAKGDVGTGAIVGSAVFNILFVIGVCAFVSTTTAQLQWWPVLRDSLYYTFTVLVLILIIYDERITALESFTMICLYVVYILIMCNNEKLKEIATTILASHTMTAGIVGASVPSSGVTIDGPDDVFGSSSSHTFGSLLMRPIRGSWRKKDNSTEMNMNISGKKQTLIEDDSMYLAALLVIIKHKRLFRSTIRFQSAARYVIVKIQHHRVAQQQRSDKQLKQSQQADLEMDYFEASNSNQRSGRDLESAAKKTANQRAKMEAYAVGGGSMSKNKFSIVSRDDYEFWHAPPAQGENYYLWLAKIPVNYVLHYTIPDCTLYPDKYAYTFIISIIWTAFFSYIMVWMVTLIGFTFGIPDSVMGVTFLAAGTSVPDCYSSIHAARNGMADMAVSNSIGSNVFDILIGLAVPWFIQSAIYPGIVATVNSRGVIYSVILLFLSLIVTIYLLNKYEWNLQPRLGLALLIAYGLFIALTCMLEFNIFGTVNPPPCPVPVGRA